MPLNLASAWEIVADRAGDRLAVHCGGVSRNWAELADRAARLAKALSEVGVGAGDNVAIALYNGNEYIEAEFAAMKCRAAVTAVLEIAEGAEVEDQALVDALRGRLSPYKLPKNIVRVDKFFRSPNGKSDFKWATKTAREALGIAEDA